MFEDDGHIVDSVGDARIALTAIEQCRYDLVIVDFAMPVMDGAALIRDARKLRPGAEVPDGHGLFGQRRGRRRLPRHAGAAQAVRHGGESS